MSATTAPTPPPLGLGTAPLANLYRDIPERLAVETIEAALDCGVTMIDTAPWYGRGLAERRTGLALRGIDRRQYVLSSKVGRSIERDGEHFDFSRDGLERSLAGSLRRLGVERLDIVYLHDPDDHERNVLEQALPVLEHWRASGIVGRIGVGMNQWQMLERFAGTDRFDMFMLAGRYTLLDRSGLPLLERCATRAARVILAGVFNSGILATGSRAGGKYDYRDAPDAVRSRVAALEAICDRFGTTLPAAAIGFARHHPAVAAVVLGASSPQEIRSNARAAAEPVPEPLLEALTAFPIKETDHGPNE